MTTETASSSCSIRFRQLSQVQTTTDGPKTVIIRLRGRLYYIPTVATTNYRGHDTAKSVAATRLPFRWQRLLRRQGSIDSRLRLPQKTRHQSASACGEFIEDLICRAFVKPIKTDLFRTTRHQSLRRRVYFGVRPGPTVESTTCSSGRGHNGTTRPIFFRRHYMGPISHNCRYFLSLVST